MDGGDGDGDGDGGTDDPDAGTDGGDKLDPQSTACTGFPATITLGPSIQVDTFGAVLCFDAAADECRLTTNTYSDGMNPCPYGRNAASFFSDGSYHTLSVPSFMSTWEIASISHGTFDAHTVAALPQDEPITAIVKSGAAGPEYTVVFQFNGGKSFTLTSFEEN